MEKDNFLTVLQEQLSGYENELSKLNEEKQSLDEKINQLERCIERVKLLEEAERTRSGRLRKVTPLPTIAENAFKGMTLPAALKVLLKGKLGMNLRQIEECLRQGGFQFDENRKPGRRINFTLVKIRWAKRREDGVWEWPEKQTVNLSA
jgi:DNA repair exonuclease SbcCD ATPase subunit